MSGNMLFHPFLDFSLARLLTFAESNIGTWHLFVLAAKCISNNERQQRRWSAYIVTPITATSAMAG